MFSSSVSKKNAVVPFSCRINGYPESNRSRERVCAGRENQGLPEGGGGPDPLGSTVSPSIVFRQC
jgi:hypothetical protein